MMMCWPGWVLFWAPNTNKNFEADARITIEIPLSFGWDMVPPLQMEIRTKAAYMPKF